MKIVVGLYLAYLPVFVFVIYQAVKAFKGYSIKKHAVSALGMRISPRNKTYNIAICIYGALGVLLALVLKENLPQSTQANLSILFMILANIGAIFAGIFPYDLHNLKHHIAGFSLFLFALLSSILFVPVTLETNWIPNVFLAFLVPFIFEAMITLYGFLFEHFNGKWMKNIWVWEWVAFVNVLANNLLLAICLLSVI